MGRRIQSALTAFCVLFTASLALFVLVNLFAAYRYPRDTRAVFSNQPVFNDTLRTIYEGIYQLPISVVREIVAESYMENAWIFEPYVQFREQPREGRFVNISSDGFRLNSRTDRKTLDPTPPSSVFILGGSTTFGYGVRDEDTIAAHLEALFRRDDPERGHRVAVYNFGRGYYGSGQELLLLKSLVQRGMVPKVAVFMDGINEQFCPQYSANIAEVFKIVQRDPAAKLREVVASLPVMRFASSPYRSELAVNAMYINRALHGYSFECGCRQETACQTQFMKTVLLNKQLIRAMAKEFGFEVHFILQPVGGYRNRFTTSPEGTKRPDHSWLWREFERHSRNGENDHSFAGILEEYQGEAFVDKVHYTSGVNRLIAERMYPSVVRSLAKAPSVASARVAPTNTERVESSIHVATDPATVFSYFTDPAKVVKWLGRSARIRPVPDGEFHVELSKNMWIRGTFLELDAPRRFVMAFRWESANENADAARLAGTSRVDISFVPQNGATLVRVVHTGLPFTAAPSFASAWAHYLTRLSLAASGRDPGVDMGSTTAGAPARAAR
jgi:uncharacterized protein YndB with AHSA1/START domain